MKRTERELEENGEYEKFSAMRQTALEENWRGNSGRIWGNLERTWRKTKRTEKTERERISPLRRRRREREERKGGERKKRKRERSGILSPNENSLCRGLPRQSEEIGRCL